jgi:hypothetical protein
VLLAIDLDDGLLRVAVKIDDETIERGLPPEFRAVKARAAQTLPQQRLRARLTSAQRPGELTTLVGHRVLPGSFARRIRHEAGLRAAPRYIAKCDRSA